jgi:hypothetical protein
VFCILNGLYLLWNLRASSARKVHVYLISFACIAYGGLIEILQGLLYLDRHSDILDFTANSIGCALALILFRRTKL